MKITKTAQAISADPHNMLTRESVHNIERCVGNEGELVRAAKNCQQTWEVYKSGKNPNLAALRESLHLLTMKLDVSLHYAVKALKAMGEKPTIDLRSLGE